MAARKRSARSEEVAAPREPVRQHPFAASLPPRALFYSRVRRAATYALALIAVSLVSGMVGYRVLENLAWLDAFHQSAMLLSGQGPVVVMKSVAGKLFDGIYALFCGVILLASTGLLFAPVLHRILHRFHLEDARDR